MRARNILDLPADDATSKEMTTPVKAMLKEPSGAMPTMEPRNTGDVYSDLGAVPKAQPDPVIKHESVSDEVMEAAWKAFCKNSPDIIHHSCAKKYVQAAVRAGVEVAMKELKTSYTSLAISFDKLKETRESLRTENVARLNLLQLADKECNILRAQLADCDWQPISNPPKEEDGVKFNLPDAPLVLYLDSECDSCYGEWHTIPTETPAGRPRKVTHWCRVAALPKAEEKCDYTEKQTPVGDIIRDIWENPPKKRIPWTMDDAVEHRDAWFGLDGLERIMRPLAISAGGIVFSDSNSYPSFQLLMTHGRWSRTPQDPGSWRGCWKEEG